MDMVRQAITADMLALLGDNRLRQDTAGWDPAKRGWYNEPWLANLRDGIHGTYTGSTCFSPVLFPKSGLKAPFTTYVLVFYNQLAGYSLGNVWGKSALSPDLLDNAAQYPEGSIIVKAAFSSVDASVWAPMAGALPWTIYTPAFDCATNTQSKTASLFPVQFFQFDIIVKDSVAAPKTSWAFSTLVYDKDVKVDDAATLSPAATPG